jgi:signal peptidase I
LLKNVDQKILIDMDEFDPPSTPAFPAQPPQSFAPEPDLPSVPSFSPDPLYWPSDPAIQRQLAEPASKGAWLLAREVLETLLLTALIFFAVNFFLPRFKIHGQSMDNTYHEGQFIAVSRVPYFWGAPQRGDVVVLVPPSSNIANTWERLIGKAAETDYIKRIIAMPGETIEIRNGQVLINGQVLENEPYIKEPMFSGGTLAPLTLKDNEVFVMGDNRNNSSDSRSFGSLPIERLVGKVMFVYWPFNQLSLGHHYHDYSLP